MIGLVSSIAKKWLSRIDPAIVLLLLFAVGLRLLFNVKEHRPGDFIYSDMWVYDHRAGHLFDRPAYAWDTFTPLGYPAFLAFLFRVFGRDYVAIGVVQAIIGGAIAPLTYVVARLATGSRLVASISGLALALYAPLIFYGGLLLTEVPFTALVLLTTIAVFASGRAGAKPLRRSVWPAAIAGLLFSMAVLVRPNLLVAFPAIAIYLWLALRRNARRTVIVLATLLASAAPLMVWASVHNSKILGRSAGLATNGGLNFFLAHEELRGASYEEPIPEGTKHHEIVPIPNAIRFTAMYESPVPLYDERHFYRLSMRRLRRHPSKLWSSLENVREGLGLGTMEYWPYWQPREKTLRFFSSNVFWALVLPAGINVLALAALRRFGRRAESGRLFIALVGFSVVPVLYLFLGDPRMRVPFDAFFVILATDLVVRVGSALVRVSFSRSQTQ